MKKLFSILALSVVALCLMIPDVVAQGSARQIPVPGNTNLTLLVGSVAVATGSRTIYVTNANTAIWITPYSTTNGFGTALATLKTVDFAPWGGFSNNVPLVLGGSITPFYGGALYAFTTNLNVATNWVTIIQQLRP
jgi:hypothetical protein